MVHFAKKNHLLNNSAVGNFVTVKSYHKWSSNGGALYRCRFISKHQEIHYNTCVHNDYYIVYVPESFIGWLFNPVVAIFLPYAHKNCSNNY